MKQKGKNESRFVFENAFQQSLYYTVKFFTYTLGPQTYTFFSTKLYEVGAFTDNTMYELNRLMEKGLLKTVEVKQTDNTYIMPVK